jgi:ATP-dependent RNA helicase DeaD
VEITVTEALESKPDIAQYTIKAGEIEKVKIIAYLINTENYDRSLAFCNTKSKVERVTKMLENKGLKAECLHGDMRQSIREKVLQDFRDGKIPILVATDVAARGLDIDDVDAVFNCDIPAENEYYVHRIGRTVALKNTE